MQLQVSLSIAPIFARYLLSFHISDLSWHGVAASVRVFPGYNAKVCFPGRALSKLWVNLPTCGFIHGGGCMRDFLRPCSRATDCSVGYEMGISTLAPVLVAFWAKLCALSLPGIWE